MRIFGGVSGLAGLKKKLSAAPVVEAAAAVAVKKATLKLHEFAVKGIRESSPGEITTRYNPKRLVVAAKEGETPNTDTGRLIQSVQFDFQNDGKTGRVGTGLRYGAWLEFGTNNMGARPWLAPALARAAEDIAKIMQTELNKGIREGFGIPKNLIPNLKPLSRDINRVGKSAKRAGKKSKSKAKKLLRKAKRSAKKAVKRVKRALR